MRINGQLEYAQFQNLTSAPSNACVGMFYTDITAPAAAIPYFYDGTTWQKLAFISTTSGIVASGSAAATKTISWSAGNTQQVNPTNTYTVISFGGTPVDGQLYTLITDNTTQIGNFFFNIAQETLGKQHQYLGEAVGQTRKYTWLYRSSPPSSGTVCTYGTILAFTSLFGIDVGYQPQGTRLYNVTSATSSQGNSGYVSSGVGQIAYGGNNAKTVVGAGAGISVRVAPVSGLLEAFAASTTPFIKVYPVLSDGTSTSAFSNPATLPAGNPSAICWSPDEQVIAVAHTTTPFVSTYPVTANAGLGVKIGNPGTLPSATTLAYDVLFAPSNDALFVLHDTAPYLQGYNWLPTPSPGFVSKMSDPTGTAAPTTQFGRKLTVRPQMDWVCYGLAASPWVLQVPYTRGVGGTFGAVVAPSLTNAPTTGINCMQFSPDGQWLAVGCASVLEPVRIYPFNSSTGVNFNGALTVGSGLTTACIDLVWSRDGRKLYAALGNTDIILITMPYISKNWIRLDDS